MRSILVRSLVSESLTSVAMAKATERLDCEKESATSESVVCFAGNHDALYESLCARFRV